MFHKRFVGSSRDLFMEQSGTEQRSRTSQHHPLSYAETLIRRPKGMLRVCGTGSGSRTPQHRSVGLTGTLIRRLTARPRADIRQNGVIHCAVNMVIVVLGGGIEPPTPGFSDRCSTTELPQQGTRLGRSDFPATGDSNPSLILTSQSIRRPSSTGRLVVVPRRPETTGCPQVNCGSRRWWRTTALATGSTPPWHRSLHGDFARPHARADARRAPGPPNSFLSEITTTLIRHRS